MHQLWRQGVDGRGVKTRDFVVERPPSEDRERLDAYIAQELAREMPELTRSRIRKLIDQGHVLRNGVLPKAGARVQTGDWLRVTIPPPQAVDLAAEDIPLDVVYQDDALLVVDKPAGLTVHPAPGHPAHTLVNALLSLCGDLKGHRRRGASGNSPQAGQGHVGPHGSRQDGPGASEPDGPVPGSYRGEGIYSPGAWRHRAATRAKSRLP